MIRILTSLVAVLTVTSIQSQTSLSQLSKILSEGRIDELSGTCMDDILNLHYNTELYNGGFITTSFDADYETFFAKNPFLYLLKNKDYYNLSRKQVVNEENRLDYHPSINSLSIRNNKTIESFLYSDREIKSDRVDFSIQLKKVSNILDFECVDICNTDPLFYVENSIFDTTFSFSINNNASKVLRIRSPGAIFFSSIF